MTNLSTIQTIWKENYEKPDDTFNYEHWTNAAGDVLLRVGGMWVPRRWKIFGYKYVAGFILVTTERLGQEIDTQLSNDLLEEFKGEHPKLAMLKAGLSLIKELQHYEQSTRV